MPGSSLDIPLVLVFLLNFVSLGASRLRTVIYAVAAQGVILGLLPLLGQLLAQGSVTLHILLMAAATVALKGIIIPRLLFYAMREVALRREVEPLIGFVPSLLLGALGTGLAIGMARTLPLVPGQVGSLIVPASLATALTGSLILVTRRKAISQAVGYLVLENGIFLFGLLLLEAMPFLVEAGVLLDLFVAVFVMGIIIHHINREFASMSSEHLTALKE
jgi:hydrogenase-4 component E